MDSNCPIDEFFNETSVISIGNVTTASNRELARTLFAVYDSGTLRRHDTLALINFGTLIFSLKFIYAAQFSLSLMAVGALMFAMLRLYVTRQRLLATSARVYLTALFGALILANVAILLSSTYHLQVLVLRQPNLWCYWLGFSVSDCHWAQIGASLIMLLLYSSATSLSVERLVGEFFVDMRAVARHRLALIIIFAQWATSITVALNASLIHVAEKKQRAVHCSFLAPMPTQTNRLFYGIAVLQALTLAIYSTLTYHHSTPLVQSEIRRANAAVHENVLVTERTLPYACALVAFFVLNVALNHEFVACVSTLFFGTPRNATAVTRDAHEFVYWAEAQMLLVPFLSFVSVLILLCQLSTCLGLDEEFLMDRMALVAAYYSNEAGGGNGEATVPIGNTYEQVGSESLYTDMLSAPSTRSSSGGDKLSCRTDVASRLKELCASRLPVATKTSTPINSGDN